MHLRVVFGVVLLAGGLSCFGQGQSAATTSPDAALRDTLLGRVDQFMTDWQKHDSAAMRALLTPEFVYVGPQGVMPGEAVVRDLSTQCTLKAYKLGEPRLLRTGNDSAALIYSIHQDLTCFGHPVEPDILNTDTLVRRDGAWMFAMTTSTVLASH